MSRIALARLLMLGVVFASMVGCGVPEEKHKAVVKDLENTKMKLSKTQKAKQEAQKKFEADIDALNAKIAELEQTKKKLQSKLEQAKGTLEMYESEHGTLEERLETTKADLAELQKARAKTEARLERFRAIANKFANMVESGKLAVKIRDGKMVIELANNILFDSGSTKIKDAGQTALAELAGVLQKINKRDFLVAGHTDDVGKAADNWELSTGRSVEVVQFLQDAGVDPTKLAAAGYGEYDPVATNDTDEGKALNRRIEIIVMPNLEELPSIPKDIVQDS